MHLSPSLIPAYGFSSVSVNGSEPAGALGTNAGTPYGPSYLDADRILYQGFGGPAATLVTYNTSTTAIVTVDALAGANLVYGSLVGVYAAWNQAPLGPYAAGVRTSIPGVGPFPGAGLGWVSRDAGQIVLIASAGQLRGLLVYGATGQGLLSIPSVALIGHAIQCEGNVLAYQDLALNWHLVNVLTQQTPSWLPGTNGVTQVTPCLIDGVLWLLEQTTIGLTLRQATASQAYVLTTGFAYWPTAVQNGTGIVRVGFCGNAGESNDSAVLIDLTVATGAISVGTVVGGGFVFTTPPTSPLALTTVATGPPETAPPTTGLAPRTGTTILTPTTTFPSTGFGRRTVGPGSVAASSVPLLGSTVLPSVTALSAKLRGGLAPLPTLQGKIHDDARTAIEDLHRQLTTLRASVVTLVQAVTTATLPGTPTASAPARAATAPSPASVAVAATATPSLPGEGAGTGGTPPPPPGSSSPAPNPGTGTPGTYNTTACNPLLPAGLPLVQCIHDVVQPGASGTLAFEVTKRVAWIARGSGLGLLTKASGDNIIQWQGHSLSISRVCFPDGHIWKCISDAGDGGTNGAAWEDDGTVDPSLYVAAIDPSLP